MKPGNGNTCNKLRLAVTAFVTGLIPLYVKICTQTIKQGGDNTRILIWSLVAHGFDTWLEYNHYSTTERYGELGEPIAKPASTMEGRFYLSVF